MKEYGLFGNKGTFKKMNLKFFETPELVKEHCVKNGYKICGIEIMENAKSITDSPY